MTLNLPGCAYTCCLCTESEADKRTNDAAWERHMQSVRSGGGGATAAASSAPSAPAAADVVR